MPVPKNQSENSMKTLKDRLFPGSVLLLLLAFLPLGAQAQNFSPHKVSKGETLFSVSRKYNVPVGQLRRDNPALLKRDNLLAGETLRIRDLKTQTGSADHSKSRYIVRYRLRTGDRLNDVAKKYNLSTEELLAENPHISDKNNVPFGTVVTLHPKDNKGQYAGGYTPAPAGSERDNFAVRYRFRHGDTIGGIAQKYLITEAEIRKANALSEDEPEVGTILKVYPRKY